MGIPPNKLTSSTLGRRRFLLGLMLGFAGGGRAAERPNNEYHVAAAVIQKFARYVKSWPEGKSPGDRPTLCVVTLSRETVGYFAEVLDGQIDGAQTWKVVHARTLEEAAGFHFVYIDAERPEPDDAWYETAGRSGVLTVGGKPGVKSRHCVIDLHVGPGGVHFDLDLRLAQMAGISIDSSLAARARRVTRR
jgi:hypothetical protein